MYFTYYYYNKHCMDFILNFIYLYIVNALSFLNAPKKPTSDQ